ncbi:ASST-domain-containing protein [Xylogone sp. PMI_703]|nr:ASST-domain-containing protein [Xylogone sp. PMI_703]
MRSFLLFAALPASLAAGFSFNAWDLGFSGLYPRRHFHSVDLEAPAPKFTHWDDRCDPGHLLLTPRGPSVTGKARGPVILDARGNLIWMETDKFQQALSLEVQKYKGEDYLTFWMKTKTKKNKTKKSYVMLNSSYEIAYKITPQGKHLKGDSHEFRITPQGTALITIYYKREADCTDLKLGKTCWIQDGMFQEIDIETGKLIFEWRATDHIPMTDVYSKPSLKDGHGKSKKDAFDFFHINSVDKLDSGDYLISARYMHAVVLISGKTGDIIWQLGGKNNHFKDLNGATDFAWQHHARWHGNNTITLFDNHANNVFHSPSKHSKGMLIQLNFDDMTATLLQKFVHPDEILNVSQGSVQLLPESGNVLVGFGNSPTWVEYSADGEVLCSAHYAPHLAFEIIDFGLVKSYRVFKSPWVGRPKTVPDVKVKNGKVYVSWNGATEVTGWRLETAKSLKAQDHEFVTIQESERNGFETSFALKHAGYVRVAALNATKEVMEYSAVVKAHPSSSLSFWPILFSTIFIISLMSFAGYVFYNRRLPPFPRRLPRLPRLQHLPRLTTLSGFPRLHVSRLPKFSDLKARWYTTVKGTRAHDPESDLESDPLLLDERDERDEREL